MRPVGIVFGSPGRSHFAVGVERFEPARVEQLLADPSIERFDKCVVRPLSGPGEVQLDLIPVRPLIERLKDEAE